LSKFLECDKNKQITGLGQDIPRERKSNKTAIESDFMDENWVLFVFLAVEARKRIEEFLPCLHGEKSGH
jgi:hypothetical protein